MKQKKLALIFVTVLIALGIISLIWSDQKETVYESHNFGGLYIEEKDYHVEPGEYQQMWITGYNAYEESEHRETFKIYIEDANVFNLIREKQEYVVTFSAHSKNEEDDSIFSLDWIGMPESKSQMRGDGLID